MEVREILLDWCQSARDWWRSMKAASAMSASKGQKLPYNENLILLYYPHDAPKRDS